MKLCNAHNNLLSQIRKKGCMNTKGYVGKTQENLSR